MLRKNIVVITEIIYSLLAAWVIAYYMKISTTAIVIFPIAILLFNLNRYGIEKKNEIRDGGIWYIIFSVIFSSMLILCKHINVDFFSNIGDITVNYISSFHIYESIAFAILVYESVFISYGLKKIVMNDRIHKLVKVEETTFKTGIENGRWLICIAIVMMVCWLPYAILYYPSLIYWDSISSISQAMGQIAYNNHHPFVYTLFIQGCLTIGKLLGDNTIGCMIYTILQMVLMSSIFSYSICWLKNKGISLKVCAFVFMFYTLPRFWAQHAISMWKDPIFSVIIFFYSLKLFDLIGSKGKVSKQKGFVVQCVLCELGISFSRNNGIYVVLFSLIVLAMCVLTKRKDYVLNKMFIYASVISVLGILLIQGPIYKANGITGDPIEAYGIPLQQVSRTVVYDGEMSDEEKAFLNELMPLEKYKENYRPGLVDNMKWSSDFNTEFFNAHQKEFRDVWLRLFIKNPKIYMEAWALNTSGFWGLNYWELNADKGNITMGVPVDSEVKATYGIKDGSIGKGESTIESALREYFSLQTPMPSIALCFWISIFMVLLTITEKQFRYILVFIPCIGNMLTLFIATPINYWPRYAISSLCLLPVCVLFPYLIRTKIYVKS